MPKNNEKPTSQAQRLDDLLSDFAPHRTDEIVEKVYGSSRLTLARPAARVYDLKQRFGYAINGWHDKDNPSLYWYQRSYAPSIQTPAARTLPKAQQTLAFADKRLTAQS